MSSGPKEFPASALKLEKLRKAGIVPFSPTALYAAAWFAAAIAAIVLVQILFSHGEAFFKQLFLGESEAGMILPIASISSALWLLLGIALIPALVVIAVGLWQTRFLFAARLLIPRLSRVAAFSDTVGSGYGARAIAAIGRVIVAFAWFAVGYGVFRWFVEYLTFARVDYSFAGSAGQGVTAQLQGATAKVATGDWAVVEHYLEVVLWMAVAATVIFAVYGACLRMVAVLSFNKQHRMTRSEIEAEIRESEPSADMRQVIRSSYHE